MMEIYDVDFIQTPNMDDDKGSLFVDATLDTGDDVTRIHRGVPESLYEAWEKDGFSVAMYLRDIQNAFPFTEESDDEDDE
ncbi:hypothetical protein [Nitratidesulfovibrio vulgaris]|uniref:Uncharacterized protein n=1 Tax=Nitratidesulfovibrio vulgaris (strain DP4) TaxID=391774 RepID=A0A0H3A9E3_NITV4|nr:hypothetical protein [Nitratidesulfovibrio vulgaris]ABM28139.1 conserved hypothetical protein [Nitratidesulfovibrio vulgaris DP4]WCB45635.1 hypothetical protein PH214_11235 [Nitratidesulfovibrio vulgaris]HBW16740.1 hypothetical protein [Desulfovibrio sp.]